MQNDKKNIKLTIENKWDIAYLKDRPFMPFGSIVNAYGLVNKGSNKTTEEFLEDMSKLWAWAVNITADLNNSLKLPKKNMPPSEEIDIPVNL